MNDERHLLFGAMALQTGLITADQLTQACALWSQRPGVSLSAILCEQGWLAPEDQTHVEYLVDRRLARFGGDIRASFAECPPEVRSALASVYTDTNNSPTLAQGTVALAAGAPVSGAMPAARTGQRYSLSKLHAAGGIGEIWLARDTDLHRDVAVKRLQTRQSGSTANQQRFLREARITGQLDHPGIVPVYEICIDETDGQPYYSMRFLKGGTLTDAVTKYHERRKTGRPDPQSFLALLNAFCIVCNTVAYAHSKGVVHRDLKCDNVILGDYGEVVVVDWGLAKQVDHGETSREDGESADLASINPAATLAGHILGTPAYMAPEQAAGRLDLIGPATDVYGLCAILYEILCGQPPFGGSNALEVLRKVQHEQPARPSAIVPGVPGPLERICLQGLAKSQAQRHPSAECLAKAVQAWVSDLAERRQAEEERERFFALSLDLLGIIDEQGRLRQVGPAWQRLLGYDLAALVGRRFLEVIHPQERAATGQCLEAVARDHASGVLEARALDHASGWRWVSWNATPIAKEQCIYVVGRDITELKKSQQLFEGILQSAPDAMVLIDALGRIEMVNRQTERVFGYTQEEMLGQPVEMLIPERFREQHPTHVANFFASSSVRPMGAGLHLLGRRKDGAEFPAEIALSPIATEGGKLVAASVRDVSDRVRT